MIGDNIRKYRKANNMSQDDLAEKLQVTRQSVSLWETGQTQPSLDSVVALARIFRITTDDLLTGDQSEPVAASPAQPCELPEKKGYGWVIALCLIVLAALIVTVWLLWDRPSDPDLDSMTITANQSSDPDGTTNSTSKPTESENAEDTQEMKKGSIYEYLKDFVIENGAIRGDYCVYSKTADAYGGYRSENFALTYWGDTDTLEFYLHRVIDDTFSIRFFISVPKEHTGTYEYVSSYYYRENGKSLYVAKGTIEAGEFTKNYPLRCTEYTGSEDLQTEFMEISRKGICDLVACLEEFMTVEKLEYSFQDLGFTKY